MSSEFSPPTLSGYNKPYIVFVVVVIVVACFKRIRTRAVQLSTLNILDYFKRINEIINDVMDAPMSPITMQSFAV